MSNNDNPTVQMNGMTRINAAKYWPNFYGGSINMELDIWLDSLSEEMQDQLADVFNNQLSEERLQFLIEHCHYKLTHDELNDNWLRSSCLGILLDDRGFKILAVIERVRSFNLETMVPTLKCSILVGIKNQGQNDQAQMQNPNQIIID